MTDRVQQILSWYRHENPGVRSNLYRMLMHGRLGGTGKFVILPVDQGFEHGPLRSFLPNPVGFDPLYHPQLALDAGCNAYAAPLGQIEAGADAYAGQLPMILKVNNHDMLHKDENPIPAITSGIDDALRLGCCAIGFTIYPGSTERETMYEELRQLTSMRVWPLSSGLIRAASTSRRRTRPPSTSPATPPRSPRSLGRTSSRSSRRRPTLPRRKTPR